MVGISRMGEVGNAFKDFTAIGPTVNLASRLQTAAVSEEDLITRDDFQKVKDDLPTMPQRAPALK